MTAAIGDPSVPLDVTVDNRYSFTASAPDYAGDLEVTCAQLGLDRTLSLTIGKTTLELPLPASAQPGLYTLALTPRAPNHGPPGNTSDVRLLLLSPEVAQGTTAPVVSSQAALTVHAGDASARLPLEASGSTMSITAAVPELSVLDSAFVWPGANSVLLVLKPPMQPGGYTITVTPISRFGRRGAPVAVPLTVLP